MDKLPAGRCQLLSVSVPIGGERSGSFPISSAWCLLMPSGTESVLIPGHVVNIEWEIKLGFLPEHPKFEGLISWKLILNQSFGDCSFGLRPYRGEMGAKEELWVFIRVYMKAPSRNTRVGMFLANTISGNI